MAVSMLKKPVNAKEYAKLEKLLDELIDVVRGNEKHPLALIMQIIGENLEQYDNEHYPLIGADVSDVELVKFLMESHDLHQIDWQIFSVVKEMYPNFLMERDRYLKAKLLV